MFHVQQKDHNVFEIWSFVVLLIFYVSNVWILFEMAKPIYLSS